jgi:hypothetical protein
MKMNRKQVAVYKGKIPHNDEYVNLPAKECISFVWELTEEIYALTGEYDVKSRLQRNVVNIIRKQG